jgi:hypothetical protein
MSTDITGTPAPSDPPGAATPPEETKEKKAKKRLWDILLTATPVILTILATMLVGKSSAEMTLAQYHGTQAAQAQSKTGDQWAFFQAKRIRGTIQGLKAERGAFNPGQMQAFADRLPDSLKRLSDDAGALVAQLDGDAAEGTTKEALASLKASVQALKQAADTAAAAAGKARANVDKMMSEPGIKSTMPFLTKKDLPLPKGVEKAEDTRDIVRVAVTGALKDLRKDDPKADEETKKDVERLYKVLSGIEKRVPRKEFEPELKKLTTQMIHAAQEAAEAKAEEYDSASKSANQTIRNLDTVLSAQRELLRPVEQAAFEVRAALEAFPRKSSQDKKAVDEAAALASSAEYLDRTARDLNARFVAASADFDQRRYEREARFNQSIAGLYEVQVRKSTFDSDTAMHKKDMYLYGMYAAQAGVAIATFAMAVRFAGVLWAIAAVAGLLAILMLGMGMGVLATLGLK